MLQPIAIASLLRLPERKLCLTVQDTLPDLPLLTPVRGEIEIQHQGTCLQVIAQVYAIVTLTCRRCLCQYNERLPVGVSEVIWLDATKSDPQAWPSEQEVPLGDLMEYLPPDGWLDVGQWLYEQISLALPSHSLCRPDCQLDWQPEEATPVDPRWASLSGFDPLE
ncbi:YceD family protein [Gloeomargarita lithophora]|uniref:YceD family protein n=1 Tax=Gloeomargarita lithophora TaxID=1188228 RepID=UPI001C12B130|nr:YceD family protein [Gloeomargarita lithophora]